MQIRSSSMQGVVSDQVRIKKLYNFAENCIILFPLVITGRASDSNHACLLQHLCTWGAARIKYAQMITGVLQASKPASKQDLYIYLANNIIKIVTTFFFLHKIQPLTYGLLDCCNADWVRCNIRSCTICQQRTNKCLSRQLSTCSSLKYVIPITVKIYLLNWFLKTGIIQSGKELQKRYAQRTLIRYYWHQIR